MVKALLLTGLLLSSAQLDLDEQLRREVRAERYSSAERLLENDAVNPDSVDEDGWTALMYAARSESPELVTLLVKARANLNLQNEDGETALVVATKRGRVESARRLLMAGADVSIRDKGGRTALGWAEDRNRTYLSQIIRIASSPSASRVTLAEQPVNLGAGHLKPPRVVDDTPPLYTESAFNRGVEGRVVLKVIIRKDGSVGPIRVHQSLDAELDSAAVEAVRTWQFEPAQIDGEPINVLADVEVDFFIETKG